MRVTAAGKPSAKQLLEDIVATRLAQAPNSVGKRLDRAQSVLVAVSGYGLPADIERGMEVGFDHHLVKPVEADRLGSLLELI